ncbi:MAG: CDP-glycerol glycerophosphotransferase family protein [Clostridia bacterium]|nr:CDP-glycerol glycerophosphotransferase family protein [Clostridia bacterium]
MKLYIDPGTGSMLFTVLIGVLGALFYLFRNLFVKIRFLLGGGKHGTEDRDRHPFVIFTDSGRYWNLFKPVCDEMEKRGEKVLYLTASEDDPALDCRYENIQTEFAGKGNRAFARMNMIRADVVLSSTPGLDVYQWKRSRDVRWYVHLPHAISDLTLYRMFGLDYYDAVLLTGEWQRAAVRKLEKMRGLPEKEMTVTGLPYMDAMLARLKAEGAKQGGETTVLLAPSWGKSGILSRYGERIFEALLRTDYHLIVRPHPQSFVSEKALVEGLMAKFPENDRLEWDRSNDNFETLRRSDILISDFSGIIVDFAFVFEKPVIYADTSFDPEPYDASWLEEDPLWTFEVLKELGVPLTPENVERIGEVIRDCLASADLKAGREKARREAWECIGCSAEKVADYLIKTRKKLQQDTKKDTGTKDTGRRHGDVSSV